MVSAIASPGGTPEQDAGITVRNAAEELRVLKAGREILERHPGMKVAIALNRAVGGGRSGLLLAVLDRLDATTREVDEAALFVLEERLPIGSDRLLKIFDCVIARATSVTQGRARSLPRPMHGA